MHGSSTSVPTECQVLCGSFMHVYTHCHYGSELLPRISRVSGCRVTGWADTSGRVVRGGSLLPFYPFPTQLR